MTLPIIIALDTKDISRAEQIIESTKELINNYKVGLEFYLKNGQEGVRKLRQIGDFDLFLDLKLYDIPNTVKGAAESISELKPKFLTVHAAGGSKMIQSAVAALPSTSIAAVTVLTSFSESEFELMGQKMDIQNTVKSWAQLAINAGATSIVCSPFEVGVLREISQSITLITPGVRIEGDEKGDQARVMTPRQALDAGANFVVIGRPITQHLDSSGELIRSKIQEISATLK